MPFVVAFTILLCVLVVSLLVTNSHLLARVVRLEREVARLGLASAREPSSSEAFTDLTERGDGDFVVVSASCASCASILDRVCRDAASGTTIVVATDTDAAMIEGGCHATVIVSAPTVHELRRVGHHLPVLIRVRNGVVSDVRTGALQKEAPS